MLTIKLAFFVYTFSFVVKSGKLIMNNKKIKPNWFDFGLAGETRFEHATYGFGDRYSTVEPLPFKCYITITLYILQQNKPNVNKFRYIFKNTFKLLLVSYKYAIIKL